MKSKKAKKITIFLILLLIIFTGFVLAEEGDIDIDSRVKEAQRVLNAPGFDVASAVGTSFSDSINPQTGSLTVTLKDIHIPGRNGLDVTITKQYSSNIFLNINSEGQQQCDLTIGHNTLTCNALDQFVDCRVPDTIDSRSMNSCKNSWGDHSSFIRPKYLGRGWRLNYLENKIKDPTSLVYDTHSSGDVWLNYQFVSSRGINSISMTIDNNEEQLILPSMFRDNNQLFDLIRGLDFHDTLNNISYWSFDVAYNSVGLNNYNIFTVFDPIAKIQNSIMAKGDGNFVAYTEDLSPVLLTHALRAMVPGQGPLTQANYHSKDGRTYVFSHPVDFCNKFDDMFNTRITELTNSIDVSGQCSSLDSISNSQNKEKIFNWAENPYAGTYLKQIIDEFGNTVTVNYKSSEGINSPFVEYIEDTAGRQTNFHYAKQTTSGMIALSDSELDLNSRLEFIDYIGPKGDIITAYYEYYTDKPLLKRTFLSEGVGSINPIPGTVYEYEYDSISQELTSVILPTGARIDYTYSWIDGIPAYDVITGEVDLSEFSDLRFSRRVVTQRTVTNGGNCGGGNTCTWTYDYTPVFVGNHWEMHTTVTNPFGNSVEYQVYAPTTAALNQNYFS